MWDIVEEDENIGKILKATRDINPLETVVTDQALVSGPKTNPVCLGCLGTLPGDNPARCSKCSWPMCSDKCQVQRQPIVYYLCDPLLLRMLPVTV